MHDVQPNGYCRTHNLHNTRCADLVDAPTFKVVAVRNIKPGDRIRETETESFHVEKVHPSDNDWGRYCLVGTWAGLQPSRTQPFRELRWPDELVVLEVS